MDEFLTLVVQYLVFPLLVSYCTHKWFKEKNR